MRYVQQTNDYDLQAIMYPLICTNHWLYTSNETEFPPFPGYIWNSWPNIRIQPRQTNNYGKYDKNGKGWSFRFDADNRTSCKHTVRQLREITLLVPTFCLMSMSLNGLWKYFKKTTRDLLNNFYGRPSFLTFSEVLISPVAPKVVWCICVHDIQLWAVAVCKLQFQTNVAIMPTNTACNSWK